MDLSRRITSWKAKLWPSWRRARSVARTPARRARLRRVHVAVACLARARLPYLSFCTVWSILEAMALGCVVLAPIRNPSGVIDHGVNGLLTPFFDSDGWRGKWRRSGSSAQACATGHGPAGSLSDGGFWSGPAAVSPAPGGSGSGMTPRCRLPTAGRAAHGTVAATFDATTRAAPDRSTSRVAAKPEPTPVRRVTGSDVVPPSGCAQRRIEIGQRDTPRLGLIDSRIADAPALRQEEDLPIRSPDTASTRTVAGSTAQHDISSRHRRQFVRYHPVDTGPIPVNAVGCVTSKPSSSALSLDVVGHDQPVACAVVAGDTHGGRGRWRIGQDSILAASS